jgi:hypothetical protein
MKPAREQWGAAQPIKEARDQDETGDGSNVARARHPHKSRNYQAAGS